jgi:hypothetical protein
LRVEKKKPALLATTDRKFLYNEFIFKVWGCTDRALALRFAKGLKFALCRCD